MAAARRAGQLDRHVDDRPPTPRTPAPTQVEVDAAGQSDRIAVTGNATLNGGTVSVLAQAGAYARNTSYTILTATGRQRHLRSVTSNFAFLTPSLGYSSNAVTLALLATANSFQNGAQTPNQRAVGAVLDQANSDRDRRFRQGPERALSPRTPRRARKALDALGGQSTRASASLHGAGRACSWTASGSRPAGGGDGQSSASPTGAAATWR